jgi:hypothetical protein
MPGNMIFNQNNKKGELLAKINKMHLNHFPQRKSKILAVLHFYSG